MTQKDKKRRYQGRVEILAAYDTIRKYLTAGYSHAWIFAMLQKQGLISVSYRQMCRCLIQFCDVKKRHKRKNVKKIETEITPKKDIKTDEKKIKEGPIIVRAEKKVEFGKEKFDMEELVGQFNTK